MPVFFGFFENCKVSRHGTISNRIWWPPRVGIHIFFCFHHRFSHREFVSNPVVFFSTKQAMFQDRHLCQLVNGYQCMSILFFLLYRRILSRNCVSMYVVVVFRYMRSFRTSDQRQLFKGMSKRGQPYMVSFYRRYSYRIFNCNYVGFLSTKQATFRDNGPIPTD